MRIALGLMRIYEMEIDEVEQLILESVDAGITMFDLADIYGGGKCEALFGEVLKRNPSLRSQIYIQSKVGIIPGFGYDLSYEYIVNKTKESIQRIGSGYLDCLFLHRVDIFMDAKEVARAIKELLALGLIRDFGVSNFTESEIEYIKSECPIPIKYNQVSLGIGNTTMLDQTLYCNIPSTKVSKESDSLFFYMKKEHIAIQAWSPFQYGFFEGSIFEPKYKKINDALEALAKKYKVSKSAIALSFLLKLTEDLIVVIGSTSIEHIKEIVEGERIKLSKIEWYTLYKECGHLLP